MASKLLEKMAEEDRRRRKAAADAAQPLSGESAENMAAALKQKMEESRRRRLSTQTETMTAGPSAQTAYRPPQTMSEAIADQWRARAAEEKADGTEKEKPAIEKFGGGTSKDYAGKNFGGDRKRKTDGGRLENTLKGAAAQYGGSILSFLGTGLEYKTLLDSERPLITEEMIAGSETARLAAELEKKNLEAEKRNAAAIRGLGREINLYGQDRIEQAKAGLGGFGRLAVDVGAGGAQLAADATIGYLTGGGTTVPLLMRSFGGGAEEAAQEGANLREQVQYGAASALTEAMTEKISSLGNFQTKAFGSGALDDILEGVVGAVERIGKTEAGRKLLNRAASAGVGFLSEGAEEFVSGVVSPLLKKGIYAQGPIDWKSVMEDAAYEFLVGGGIGAISGGLGGTNTRDVQSQYLTGVTERAQNDAYRAMAEKGMFSQEAMKTARDALGTIDKAWEHTGMKLPGTRDLTELESTRTEADGEETGGDIQTLPQAQTGAEARENVGVETAGPAEAQKNTATGAEAVSTGVDADPQTHTAAEMDNIRAYQAAADKTILAFIDKWKNLQNPNYKKKIRMPVAEVSERTAQDVKRLTGVNVDGFEHVISGGALEHIEARHGVNGSADHSMADPNDIARIGYVLENYDSAELLKGKDGKPRLSREYGNSDHTPAVMVRFQKQVDGTYFVVEAAPDSAAQQMRVVSAYMKKRTGNTGQLLNIPQSGPQPTPEAPNGASVSDSDGIIPQAAPAVNSRSSWGFVESGSGAELSKADRKMLNDLGRITRSEIRTVTQEELDRLTGKTGADGVQLGDRIYISEAADRPVLEIARHELTHRIQETAPEEYGVFRDYVAGVYQSDGSLEGYIQGIRESRARAGIELSDAEIMDEIAADYAGQLLVDERAVHRMAGDDPGLLKKLLDSLREIIAKIRRAFGGQPDAQAEELERAARLWEDALRSAGENAETEGTRRPAEEEAKPRFSIAYDQENKPFVIVEEDILEGVPEGQWISVVKNNLKQKFPDGITVGKNQIKIDKQSRRELTRSRQSQYLRTENPTVYADKFRATNNADEILLASRDYVNEGLNHPRKDNIQDFARGTVQLQIGGRDYTAEVVVGTRSTGEMILYDLLNLDGTQIQEKRQTRHTVDPSPGTGRKTVADSADTLPQTTPDVKPRRTFSEEVMAQLTGEDLTSEGTPSETSFSEEIMRQLTGKDSRNDGTETEEIPGSAQLQGLSLPTLESDSETGIDTSGNTRYSMKGDADIQKEVERLRRQNRRLTEQMKRTDAPRRNQEAVAREAGVLLKEYSSTYDRSALADRLQTLWDHQADRYGGAPWVREKAPTTEEIRREAKEIAMDILENNEEQTNTLYEQYEDLRKELRTRGISIAP